MLVTTARRWILFRNKVSSSRAIGTKVDCTSCEMDGIVLGLELLLQYFTDKNKMSQSDKSAYILCDSSAYFHFIPGQIT